jgi:hypothetical protein
MVNAPYIIAEDVPAILVIRNLASEFLDRLYMTCGMVRMWEIRRPEEAIAAAQLHHRR